MILREFRVMLRLDNNASHINFVISSQYLWVKKEFEKNLQKDQL